METLSDGIGYVAPTHVVIDTKNANEVLLVSKVKKFFRSVLKEPYAYLCEECCTMLECPCFIDGKCPECGSTKKNKLVADFQLNKLAGDKICSH